jgi:hypothetical protein
VDRFPSTSTAKTTVSDIDIILADGSYRAVVTFMSEHLVVANIEECVADACVAAWDRKTDSEIAERLLNHRDQRFRPSYTLGTLTSESDQPEADEFSFADESESGQGLNDEDDTTENDRSKNTTATRDYVDRIKRLTHDAAASVSLDLGEDISRLIGADGDAAQEFLEIGNPRIRGILLTVPRDSRRCCFAL